MRLRSSAQAALVLGLLLSKPAFSQAVSPDPAQWRPLSFSNLQQPTPEAKAFVDLWSDELAANNRAYIQHGAMAEGASAPAIEAHVVVRSPEKTAVLSMLSTGTGCTVKTVDYDRQAVIKLCPLRVALYESGKVTVTRGRKGCFLEMGKSNESADPANTTTWASYDVRAKAFRLGVILNHETVPGCSMNIPIYGLPPE